MEKHEIKLTFEVHCEGSQGDAYRIYLDKDLLTERQWRWVPTKTYLKEVAPLRLPKGEYDLRIERVEPATGVFTIKNVKVENATLDGQTRIVVQ